MSPVPAAAKSRTDSARVTTVVAVHPHDAFDVFTSEIDLWWRRGPRHRFGDRAGTLRFEPGVGGRLVETFEGGDVYEVGRVLAWEPGARLAFEMKLRAFAAGETTQVEITFEPVEQGTRVTLEHRGWDAIPREHRARHGLEGGAFLSMIGLWWGDLMTSARIYAGERKR